jgi:flagellar basal body-associated protein FliL
MWAHHIIIIIIIIIIVIIIVIARFIASLKHFFSCLFKLQNWATRTTIEKHFIFSVASIVNLLSVRAKKLVKG